jgi:hypothetical protein
MEIEETPEEPKTPEAQKGGDVNTGRPPINDFPSDDVSISYFPSRNSDLDGSYDSDDSDPRGSIAPHPVANLSIFESGGKDKVYKVKVLTRELVLNTSDLHSIQFYRGRGNEYNAFAHLCSNEDCCSPYHMTFRETAEVRKSREECQKRGYLDSCTHFPKCVFTHSDGTLKRCVHTLPRPSKCSCNREPCCF